MDELVATFSVRLRRFVDAAGDPVGPLPPFVEAPGELESMYRAMVLARRFDIRCVALQRTGRLGTFATAFGQEAVPIGLVSAMRADDVLVPTYREAGAQIERGVAIEELLAYWGGDERGHAYADPAVAGDYPVCITVGNQALHAAGVATALKLQGTSRAVVCVMGDGATSKGDVYEAINVAGAWRLPVVFVVCNNGWAISTPLHRQTGAATLAQKAFAGGLEALQTDGNDVIAVRDAVAEALERARSGAGGTVVECLTYRLNDHNTADDATRYRDPAEVEARRVGDPIARLRVLLAGLGRPPDDAAIEAAADRALDAAVERYLAGGADRPEAMFEHVFARPAGDA